MTFSELSGEIDTLYIASESVVLKWAATNEIIDSSLYKVFAKTFAWNIDSLSLLQKRPKSADAANPRFLLSYRIYRFNWNESYSHLDSTLMQQSINGDYIGFDFSPYEPVDNLTDFQGLDYSGSFSRGVSFGNAQNLVLNSQFNLQLAGKIGNDIEILAAITDQNIPLQPEGNTQQLQEFDKIFIQLKKDNNKLIAGDYELAKPNSYFMNYFKKLQGATFTNLTEVGKKKNILNTRVSGAIARGKFARNTIPQQEGNQGPYRLRGNNGERFIIIESGTEKVYLDGQLLKRGLEEDYVIDYNQADVTFTTNRLITKDTRIIVEFEYSDQNFLRSSYSFDSEYKVKKGRLYFNLFSEQDSKSSGNIQDLDSLQLAAIRESGNNVNNVFAPGIDTVETFDEFQVKYKLIDTTYQVFQNGVSLLIQDTILVYSTNPDSAKYVSSWTDLGAGNGDYILDASIPANGRAYRWITPDELGNHQGQFAPLIKLNVPNQQQLYTMGMEWEVGKNSVVQIEGAMSNNDLNRLSKEGNSQNQGFAAMARYAFKKKTKKNWTIETNLQYEWTQDRFKALNPYRNAEFNRDWNIANSSSSNSTTNTNGVVSKAEEQVASAGFALKFKNIGLIQYDIKAFRQQDTYNGLKHEARSRWQKNGFVADIQASFLSSDGEREESEFFRPKGDISKTFKKLNNLRIGVYAEREKNSRFIPETDSLNSNSFYYDLLKFYIKSDESKSFGLGANYSQRYDFAPSIDKFQQSTYATDINVNGYWRVKSKSQLKWNLTYRQLEIEDPSLSEVDPQETFLGEIEHSMRLWKQVIRSTTNYQISSGQEPKIEYQYIPVAPGQGNYNWTDLNKDSTVQLDEIQEIAFSDQGNALRVTIFTDDFIRTNNVQLNQSFFLRAPSKWQKKKWLKIPSRLTGQSVLVISRRTRQGEGVSPWNPFQLEVADTSLVSTSSRIRNVLYYNQGHEKFELQTGWLDTRRKSALTSGFESRSTREQYVYTRWNLSTIFSLELRGTQGNRDNDSEFFDNRDYVLDYYKVEPKFTFQPSGKFKVSVAYKYEDSQNTISEAMETAMIHDFKLELGYRKGTKTKIDLSGTYSEIVFDGESNSPIELAMLQGLQNGRNYQWSLALNRSLTDNVVLNISYDGRRTGVARTVHIGRMLVRASF
ncbi:MAG: hypothetical protein ACI9VN_000640 [Patescibacteria group bacterium]|jgi:hypothetical protein